MSAAQVHVRHMMDRIEQSYSEPITLHSLAAEIHRQGPYPGALFRPCDPAAISFSPRR